MENMNIIKGYYSLLNGQTAYQYHEFSKKFMKKEFMYLARLIRNLNLKNPFILDIGCGAGSLMFEINREVPDSVLYGLDTSLPLLEIGENNLKDEYIYFNYWEDTQFPFCENSFDLAISNWALHKWNNTEQVFEEIKRTLKPDGILFIVDVIKDMNETEFNKMTHNNLDLINKGFIDLDHAYSLKEMKKLLKRDEYQIIKQWSEKGQLFTIIQISKINQFYEGFYNI